MTGRAISNRHETEARLHRALSDPSRLRILEVLREAETPLDAAEVAAQIGLHVNTVRTHLGLLADADLVSSQRERGSRPGRPRVLFEPNTRAAFGQENRGYRLLSEIFAGAIASSGVAASAELEQAGSAWGRYLVERRVPLRDVSPVEATQELLRLNSELDFEPEFVETDERMRLVLRRCPFGELAEDFRNVVCPVHLGLMRGALAELGAGLDVCKLDPFVEPNVCVAELVEVEA